MIRSKYILSSLLVHIVPSYQCIMETPSLTSLSAEDKVSQRPAVCMFHLFHVFSLGKHSRSCVCRDFIGWKRKMCYSIKGVISKGVKLMTERWKNLEDNEWFEDVRI